MARDTKRASCDLAGFLFSGGGDDGFAHATGSSSAAFRETYDARAMAARRPRPAMRPHRAPCDPLPCRRSGPMASEASRSEACRVARSEDERARARGSSVARMAIYPSRGALFVTLCADHWQTPSRPHQSTSECSHRSVAPDPPGRSRRVFLATACCSQRTKA